MTDLVSLRLPIDSVSNKKDETESMGIWADFLFRHQPKGVNNPGDKKDNTEKYVNY